MSSELLEKITHSVIEGDPDATVAFTRTAIEAGLEPMEIIEQGLVPGMKVVGDKFAEGEYFLPNLIISANGMQDAMKLLEPELAQRQQTVKVAGKVVLGTVRGDIHEIGKSLVGTMLSASGFQVFDLGTDVPTEQFVEMVRSTGADVVGLSALLTTTMTVQRQVIEALAAAGLRQQVKVVVGGAPVTHSWAEEIGADGYAEDAISAVTMISKLVEAS